MHRLISIWGIVMASCALLFSSCTKPENHLPLRVMHGVVGDTLKVLAKGSPPFDIRVLKSDTILWEQTLDSVGFVALPITDFRANAGEYQVKVESVSSDTLLTLLVTEKSVEQLFAEQQASINTQLQTSPLMV
ncbi:MAG: hypothetical protein AAFR36_33140 [Bacteroidota bacterium]